MIRLPNEVLLRTRTRAAFGLSSAVNPLDDDLVLCESCQVAVAEVGYWP
jgi:hypothetical protein